MARYTSIFRKKCGVGINDFGHTYGEDGKQLRSYIVWSGMIARCYSKYRAIKHPTYIDCVVCDEWLRYSNFKKWYDEQEEKIGLKELVLDKDLLVEGNKVYCQENCILIPKELNAFLAINFKNNTSGHVGVYVYHKRKKPYMVGINDFRIKKLKNLGYYSTMEEAIEVRNKARLELVELWKEKLRTLGYEDYIINKVR